MGYRGKVDAQRRACELRATGRTLADIAAELGVAKSSVGLWVRDVEFVPSPRRTGSRRRDSALQRRKKAEIDALLAEGRSRIARLTDREFLAAGVALYAGEGSKGDRKVVFANTDSRMVAFFCAWLRRFFPIDEDRLRVRIYLHEGLDLDAAEEHWSQVTKVPRSQFRTPYRAIRHPTIRSAKHAFGCAYVTYSCSRTHRSIMGLVSALLSSESYSGVAQLAEHATVNRVVEGPSPSPGALPDRVPIVDGKATS